MTVKKCDACGAEIGTLLSKFTAYTEMLHLGDDENGAPYNEVRPTKRVFDLCEKCALKIVNNIVWGRMKDD